MTQDPRQAAAAFWKTYFAKMRRPVAGDAISQTTPAPLQAGSAVPPSLAATAEPVRLRRRRVTLAAKAALATQADPATPVRDPQAH